MAADRRYDAVVIGAGPNGLAAAITLARAGRSVVVLEAADRPGGGLKSEELTLPGFTHDICSSVYALAAASPFFRSLPFDDCWSHPVVPLAHPFDDGRAVVLSRSVGDTAAGLGVDGRQYARLFAPYVSAWKALVDDVLAPPRMPSRPALMARFAWQAWRSADQTARRFQSEGARALFAGLAAHSILPFDAHLSSAAALVLGALAEPVGWPFARGGAGRLAETMAAYLTSLGGEIVTARRVSSLDDVPPSRAVLCDVTPRQFLSLAGDRLPARFRAALERFRYGPGAYKIDWALRQPIPWRATECRRAGTVHVGGTFEEIARAEHAPWNGIVPEQPFAIVTQPSLCDSSRAPAGAHTAWAYCHVPSACLEDMTERIERQIERFAPGFRDVILARHMAGPADLERRNPNLVGGAIGGGVMNLRQMVARPTHRTYRTPIAGVYLCSSSTPPGGGVHGMCGYHAARAALAS